MKQAELDCLGAACSQTSGAIRPATPGSGKDSPMPLAPWRRLTRWLSAHTRVPQAPLRRGRPQLECLEERIVPDAVAWQYDWTPSAPRIFSIDGSDSVSLSN